MPEKFPQPTPERDYRAEAIEKAHAEEYDAMLMERDRPGGGLPLPAEDVRHRPFKDSIGRVRQPSKKFAPTSRPEAGNNDEQLPSSYAEMSEDQLDQLLLEAQPQDETLRENPVFTSVVEDIQTEKLNRKKVEWASMGMFELARELAKAELTEDETFAEVLDDILIDKWIDQSQKFETPGEEFKGDTAAADRSEKLWARLQQYKDSYKDKIAAEALQNQWDETRSKINYDIVDSTRQKLDQRGAPTSDILRDMPAESFIGNKTPEELQSLLPDVYFRWQESLPDRARNRIDKDTAAKWMIELNKAGVPHEIMQDFPAEFFYSDGDPDQVDETPESFRKWQEEHPDVKIAEDLELLRSAEAPIAEPASEPAIVSGGDETVDQPTYNRSTRAKAKLTGAIFAIQEKLGTRRGRVGLAVGALALGAGLIIARKAGVDFNPFDDGHKNALDAAAPKGGGSGAHHEVLRGHGSSGASHDVVNHHGSGISAHEAANSHHFERLNGQNDTIWDHAERALKKEGVENPSDKQIVKKTQSILMSNGITWKGARSLPIGYKFKV